MQQKHVQKERGKLRIRRPAPGLQPVSCSVKSSAPDVDRGISPNVFPSVIWEVAFQYSKELQHQQRFHMASVACNRDRGQNSTPMQDEN